MRRLVGSKYEIVVAGERSREVQEDDQARLKAQLRLVTMNLWCYQSVSFSSIHRIGEDSEESLLHSSRLRLTQAEMMEE